jgi:hypothetical protein
MITFWILIVICIVLAMMSELLKKERMKVAARWIFVGAILLLVYKWLFLYE